MPSKLRSSSALARFFQNEKGDWVLLQWPNLLLWLWILVQATALALKDVKAFSILASMLLFTWAYGELRRGESPFRRVLGGGILLMIVINLFIKWQ